MWAVCRVRGATGNLPPSSCHRGRDALAAVKLAIEGGRIRSHSHTGNIDMDEDAKSILRQLFERVIARGDHGAVTELVHPDCHLYHSGLPEPAYSRALAASVLCECATSFPDLQLSIESIITPRARKWPSATRGRE